MSGGNCDRALGIIEGTGNCGIVRAAFVTSEARTRPAAKSVWQYVGVVLNAELGSHESRYLFATAEICNTQMNVKRCSVRGR